MSPSSRGVRLTPRLLADAMAVIAMALYAAIVAFVAARRFDAFTAFGDLTAFGQFFANSMRGDWFQSTYPWSVHDYWSLVSGGPTLGYAPSVSSLGIHFEVGLAVLFPLYAIWPHVEMLIALQVGFVIAGGIAIYAFARERVGPVLALALLGSFLLHPALAGTMITDFHAQALLTCWLAFVLLAVESGRTRALVPLAALTLLTNEVAAIPMVMIGLYLAVVKRRWMTGVMLAIVSGIYFVVVTSFVIPAFSPTGGYLFTGYFSHWGGSPTGLLHAILTTPAEVFTYLTGPTQVTYVLALFGPVLFLSLAAPELLAIAAPVILANLLADSDAQRSMSTHYSATVLPVLYFSAAVGLQRLSLLVARATAQRIRYGLAVHAAFGAGLLAAALFLNSLGPYPLVKGLNASAFRPPSNAATLQRLIASIPAGTSIATVDNFSTHFADHREVHIFPVYAAQVDYVLLPTSGERMWPLTQQQEDTFLKPLIVSSDHEILAQEDGYILIRRRKP